MHSEPHPESAYNAAPFIPARATLKRLQQAAAVCAGCPLYRHATQTVFGVGPRHASIVLIGEQPGDREDIEGLPFVGPAGQLLDRALAAAVLPREQVYITNAVKHFKWERRGKRRLHKHPEDREIAACRPWLQAEIAVLKAQVIVCLGVSAAKAAFGKSVKLKDLRGTVQASPLARHTIVTNHPAALLRLTDRAAREHAFAALVADLKLVHRVVRPT